MGKTHVSVVIPTFQRANLLGHVLNGLTNQSYGEFEVIIILKPSRDGTETVINSYEKSLKIRLILQEKGNFTDALNIGLENASGDIIAFLDDDAIPSPNWLQNLIETYSISNVGGVAGDVITAFFTEESLNQINIGRSQLIPETKPFMQRIGLSLWDSPLVGLENYLVYVSKAGIVSYNFDVGMRSIYQTTLSLLGMGANMSVLAKAVDKFRFHNSNWMLGLASEQFLGLSIWKKGYKLLFNPNAKVYHLTHSSTMTRNLYGNATGRRKNSLCNTESNLLFYRLYGLEPGLSLVNRIAWVIFSLLFEMKKIVKNKDTYRITYLKNIFHTEIIGLTWILSRRLGGNFTIQRYLQSFLT